MTFYEGTVLTSPADGIAPSLLLSCGSRQCYSRCKYVFNLPESLDRLASDQKIPMRDVAAIFTPEVSTAAMGGLGSRLFKCASKRDSCHVVAPMGLRDWLVGVRTISGKLGDLRLHHYVVRPNGNVSCYRDSLIEVAGITRGCESTRLPQWLEPDTRMDSMPNGTTSKHERSGRTKRKARRGRGKEQDEKGKGGDVESSDTTSTEESEEEEDDDEVVLLKEVGARDKNDADVPEVICIDLASEDEDGDKVDDREKEAQAASEGPEGSADNSSNGCTSGSSSVGSFVPLFKPKPSESSTSDSPEKVPRHRGHGGGSDEGPSNQGNAPGVDQRPSNGGPGADQGKTEGAERRGALPGKLHWCSRRLLEAVAVDMMRDKRAGGESASVDPEGKPDRPAPDVPIRRKRDGVTNPEEIVLSSSSSESDVRILHWRARKSKARGKVPKRLKKRRRLEERADAPRFPRGQPPASCAPHPWGQAPLHARGIYNAFQRPGWQESNLVPGFCQPALLDGIQSRRAMPPGQSNVRVHSPRQLSEPRVMSWTRQPEPIAHPCSRQPDPKTSHPTASESGDSVLAYIVRVKSTDGLVIVVFAQRNTDIKNLTDHAAWTAATERRDRVDVIFHLSAPDVIDHDDYQVWLRKLPGKQVVVTDKPGDASLSIGLRHVLDRGSRLNLVSPIMFPLPYVLRNAAIEKETTSLPQGCSPAWILTSVELTVGSREVKVLPSEQPAVNMDMFRKEVLNVNVRLVQEIEALEKIGLLKWSKSGDFYSTAMFHPMSFLKVRTYLTSSPEINSSAAFEYASSIARRGFPLCVPTLLRARSQTGVFFFGTGCSEPSSWRGGCGILLTIQERGVSMMIDAAEGTYGQMVRYFGEQGAREIVDSLECIWISHQHGDHCLGLAALLAHRSKDAKPLLVLAPQRVIEHVYCAKEAFGFNVHAVNIKHQANDARVMESQRVMGLHTLWSVRVEHSCEAYGLVLAHEDGWKVVYSGDTRPCPLLRQAGANCTVLIHEATHAPAEQHEATKRMHSTWSEALAEGYHMNAYRTILTHFSRRYPNLPTGLTPEELGESGTIAFDGMNVPFSLLPFLPRLNPAIHEALHQIEEGGEIDMSDNESECL